MQHSAAATLSRPVAAPAAPLIRPMAASAAPLAGLAGTELSRRFRHWRGASGRRHLFSVFPLGSAGGPTPGDDAPRFADAVVMAVGRDAEGIPRIFALDETGPFPDLFYGGSLFRAALAEGADEVHVHLLADGPAARSAVLRDLEAA